MPRTERWRVTDVLTTPERRVEGRDKVTGADVRPARFGRRLQD